MVRTLTLLAALVLVAAAAGPAVVPEAAADRGASATALTDTTGTDGVLVGTQGATTVQADWAVTYSVEEVAGEALRAALAAEEPPIVLAPIAGASRYGGADALSHETRERLFETVVDTPGIHLAGLADAVGEPLSTVRYHSRVLQSDGLIDAEKHRGYKRLFPVTADGADRPLHTALASEAKRSVLLSVARMEPVSVTNVAQELDRAPSTVSHHLTQLETDGLVVRERDGETVVTRLVPSVRSELTDGA